MTDSHLSQAEPERVRLVPYPEVRQQLGGISPPTMYKLIANGDLDRVRIGTHRCFITQASIDAFIARQVADFRNGKKRSLCVRNQTDKALPALDAQGDSGEL